MTATVRPCGDCSMCCKILPITKTEGTGDEAFPFDKPENEWCRHCAPGRGGCKVWNTELPNLCRSYQCLWKISDMPEEWRPDKIRAIFSAYIRLDKFPEELFFEIALAPDGKMHTDLATFLQRTDISYFLRYKGNGIAHGRTPDMHQAILEQFKGERG